ncbi:hypothetical protein EV05_1000 [Prochlorococcus sp. MIT 0601]|nr:hypothetical protein EV05_1000 [Prochlorococcus sp. MIT 0601]
MARDYDVFFAAIGLLCGGILFFQGWRLDPILQFGQFLLAGTTVFFAYESVRLRGVATDQARRSSYFDDDFDSPVPPKRSYRSSDEDDFDQFEEPQSIRRRFSGSDRDDYGQSDEDFYRPKRTPRPAIPEQAASRRSRVQSDSLNQDPEQSRRMARFRNSSDQLDKRSSFGDRRSFRQDQRRGSRPVATRDPSVNRRSRDLDDGKRNNAQNDQSPSSRRFREPKGAPINRNAEDAAFSPSVKRGTRSSGSGSGRVNPSARAQQNFSDNDDRSPRSPRTSNSRPRDNSSRFDD